MSTDGFLESNNGQQNRGELEAAGQPLTAYEIAEVQKRLAEHAANPQGVVTWRSVKANLNLNLRS